MEPGQPRRLTGRRIMRRKRKTLCETSETSVHSSVEEESYRSSDQSGSATQKDWSELSPEILLAIGKRNKSRIDVSKFRSVCKNWRSSLPLPQNPNFLNPLLPLQLQIPNSNPLPFTQPFHRFFTLVATTVFLVQLLDSNANNSDSKGWILYVEELKPGKFNILYPVSKVRVKYKDPGFPKFLNIDEFRVSEIGKGYLLRVSDLYQVECSYSACKVVLCLNSAEKGPYSTADDCTAIVLYTDGTLIGLRLRDGNWGYVHQSLISRFKDILWVGGVLYAVDDGGMLYVIDHMTLKVTETIVNHPIVKGLGPIRLVGSSGESEIYLVALYSKWIYKLNRMQHKWEVLSILGNKILYLGCDGSFMVPTQRLLGHDGDFMIFNNRIFDGYSFDNLGFREAAKDLGVLMYNFRSSMESRIDLSYQAISSSLWPPPTWFWQDAFPSNKDTENNQQLGVRGQWPLNSHKKATTPLRTDNQSQNVESCRSVATKVKFEGVEIRSDLVSTLQKIWAKHGNVLEGSCVHSKDMLKTALKSLAKAVTILQSSSGRTLTKSQCDDVSYILMDLKRLQLRVEWLEPFVEKAVTLHQRKPMVDALEDLEKNIAKAKVMKLKFTKELANLEEVEKELQADKTLVSEKIPIEGRVNLDQYIGDGLL